MDGLVHRPVGDVGGDVELVYSIRLALHRSRREKCCVVFAVLHLPTPLSRSSSGNADESDIHPPLVQDRRRS